MPETIEIIPFGIIVKDRFELSKKYGLVEKFSGFWRLTKKCKDNYTYQSYFYYLRGAVEKPERINKTDQPVQEYKPIEKKEITKREIEINELLLL